MCPKPLTFGKIIFTREIERPIAVVGDNLSALRLNYNPGCEDASHSTTDLQGSLSLPLS